MSEINIDEIVAKVTEALSGKMAEIANGAATAHSKRLEKQIEAMKVAPAPVVEQPKADPVVTEKIKQTPELAAMQTQLEELKKSLQKSESDRQEAVTRERNNVAYGQLREALSQVKPELREVAAKHLFHVENRVQFGDDGTPVFRHTRDAGGGFTEEVMLPLAVGVEHWQKSKEASAFLPAPGGQPGQGRGGKAPATAAPSGRAPNGMPIYDKAPASDDEKVERAMEQARAIAALGLNL